MNNVRIQVESSLEEVPGGGFLVCIKYRVVPPVQEQVQTSQEEQHYGQKIWDRAMQAKKKTSADKNKTGKPGKGKKAAGSVPQSDSRPAQDPDRKTDPKMITKADLLIDPFEWDPKIEKEYGSVIIAELPDGRVMLNAWSAKVYTTKEKILKLPYPMPYGYLKNIGLSANYVTAIRRYREYLAVSVLQDKCSCDQDPDRKETTEKKDTKEIEDPDDWKYKPMLNGAFSTRPGNDDMDKVENVVG